MFVGAEELSWLLGGLEPGAGFKLDIGWVGKFSLLGLELGPDAFCGRKIWIGAACASTLEWNFFFFGLVADYIPLVCSTTSLEKYQVGFFQLVFFFVSAACVLRTVSVIRTGTYNEFRRCLDLSFIQPCPSDH